MYAMDQKTITSYFTKSSKKTIKRSLSETENFDASNVEVKDIKQFKSDQEVYEENSKLNEKVEREKEILNSSNISKEDPVKFDENMTNRIELNRLAAQLKLVSKSFPALHPNMGLSWFQALKNEFDKPYFKKVIGNNVFVEYLFNTTFSISLFVLISPCDVPCGGGTLGYNKLVKYWLCILME